MADDIIDNASEIEELQRNAALSAHRIDHNAVSAEHCEECDDQLREERRQAYSGCTMCVSCLAEKEKRSKHTINY